MDTWTRNQLTLAIRRDDLSAACNIIARGGLSIDAELPYDPDPYSSDAYHGPAENFETLLIMASGFGSISVLEWLVKEGANLDKTDANGMSPLMFAARGGHVAAAKLLLSSGARADVKDLSGRSTYAHVANGCDELKQLIEPVRTHESSKVIPFKPRTPRKVGQ